MPIYEFSCQSCKHTFEELVMKDSDPVLCPSCGAAKAERLLSCACLHMPAPSRAGQVVRFPTSSKSACGGCSGGNCSTC